MYYTNNTKKTMYNSNSQSIKVIWKTLGYMLEYIEKKIIIRIKILICIYD